MSFHSSLNTLIILSFIIFSIFLYINFNNKINKTNNDVNSELDRNNKSMNDATKVISNNEKHLYNKINETSEVQSEFKDSLSDVKASIDKTNENLTTIEESTKSIIDDRFTEISSKVDPLVGFFDTTVDGTLKLKVQNPDQVMICNQVGDNCSSIVTKKFLKDNTSITINNTNT
jgi:hypothetical protein